MTVLASRGQLRASFLRWSLLIVPAVLLAGFASGVLGGSGPGNLWFDALHKPPIYPPPATFGIVWSILYVMMGVALTMIVSARGASGRGVAIVAFLIQLALNLAWSPLFFGAHRITAALYLLAARPTTLVALIKPQFEVGKGEVGKGGVVRDPALHQRVCAEVHGWLEGAGWDVLGIERSPITGPEGNVEFLIAARRG